MAQASILVLVAFAAIMTCSPAQPQKEHPKGTEEVVAVVAEPKFYVIGAISGDEMQLFKEADPKQMWKVDGFVFEVLQPLEYAGRIIGMHHDGV